ncbi:hypothetical protein H696_01270 [Fonticula alba]|uniref:FHA domain-containing protein n=1 Tax=Fonticula alba TaxID=691883 RepID=A0A058ZEH5_FONAL|nr:hypothetical protein H696_01270 [Fonticula alba]KCV71857.1 hypothetical protein H696_01270 [Fonticula alba]|eukprot:XP_009493435.1 hypothetical protein H696_01270 [Fonticula alba]
MLPYQSPPVGGYSTAPFPLPGPPPPCATSVPTISHPLHTYLRRCVLSKSSPYGAVQAFSPGAGSSPALAAAETGPHAPAETAAAAAAAAAGPDQSAGLVPDQQRPPGPVDASPPAGATTGGPMCQAGQGACIRVHESPKPGSRPAARGGAPPAAGEQSDDSAGAGPKSESSLSQLTANDDHSDSRLLAAHRMHSTDHSMDALADGAASERQEEGSSGDLHALPAADDSAAPMATATPSQGGAEGSREVDMLDGPEQDDLLATVPAAHHQLAGMATLPYSASEEDMRRPAGGPDSQGFYPQEDQGREASDQDARSSNDRLTDTMPTGMPAPLAEGKFEMPVSAAGAGTGPGDFARPTTGGGPASAPGAGLWPAANAEEMLLPAVATQLGVEGGARQQPGQDPGGATGHGPFHPGTDSQWWWWYPPGNPVPLDPATMSLLAEASAGSRGSGSGPGGPYHQAAAIPLAFVDSSGSPPAHTSGLGPGVLSSPGAAATAAATVVTAGSLPAGGLRRGVHLTARGGGIQRPFGHPGKLHASLVLPLAFNTPYVQPSPGSSGIAGAAAGVTGAPAGAISSTAGGAASTLIDADAQRSDGEASRHMVTLPSEGGSLFCGRDHHICALWINDIHCSRKHAEIVLESFPRRKVTLRLFGSNPTKVYRSLPSSSSLVNPRSYSQLTSNPAGMLGSAVVAGAKSAAAQVAAAGQNGGPPIGMPDLSSPSNASAAAHWWWWGGAPDPAPVEFSSVTGQGQLSQSWTVREPSPPQTAIFVLVRDDRLELRDGDTVVFPKDHAYVVHIERGDEGLLGR